MRERERERERVGLSVSKVDMWIFDEKCIKACCIKITMPIKRIHSNITKDKYSSGSGGLKGIFATMSLIG